MEKNKPIYHGDFEKLETARPMRTSAYKDEIHAHMRRCFPNREEIVFYDRFSDLVEVNLHMLKAPTRQDVHVIYTVGMSAMPMSVPETQANAEALRYAELILFLPAEWELTPLESKEDEDNRIWWPMTLLKFLARFPHEFHTWLGFGHVVSNSADFAPYDVSTKLCGTMLAYLQEEVSLLQTKDGNPIQLYPLIPLYKEEMEWQQEEGIPSLYERLAEINGSGMIVFPDRPNVCLD